MWTKYILVLGHICRSFLFGNMGTVRSFTSVLILYFSNLPLSYDRPNGFHLTCRTSVVSLFFLEVFL